MEINGLKAIIIGGASGFARATADRPEASAEGRGRDVPLRTFAEQRRTYLLNFPEIKQLAR